MNVMYLIWSRGRLISPSLPVDDGRYLNLSSQKRPMGRNLGGNRSVRRSGTTSRGTVVLVFCLRMRRLPLTLVLTIFAGITRASFLNMRADLSSSWLIRTNHFVIILPYDSLWKMSKNGNTSDWLQQKILYLVLMHFIVDLAQKWLRENTFYYPLLHFVVDFACAAWLWEQTFT